MNAVVNVMLDVWRFQRQGDYYVLTRTKGRLFLLSMVGVTGSDGHYDSNGIDDEQQTADRGRPVPRLHRRNG